jgi:hypothetical protein
MQRSNYERCKLQAMPANPQHVPQRTHAVQRERTGHGQPSAGLKVLTVPPHQVVAFVPEFHLDLRRRAVRAAAPADAPQRAMPRGVPR